MDKDGTRSGFDLGLTRAVSDAVEIPVIASGGVGGLQDLADGIKLGGADAVLTASIFHFGQHTGKRPSSSWLQQIPMRVGMSFRWLNKVKWDDSGLVPVIAQKRVPMKS